MMNEVVPKQFAAAYMHPGFFCIVTWSGYRSSSLDPQGVQHLLPPDTDDAALGRATLDALAHSRFFSAEEVRTSSFFNAEQRKLNYTQWVEKLRSAYDLSKRALFQDLEHCGITATGGTITIKPLRHVKPEAWEGFAPEVALPVSADSPPQDIGATLRRAFAVCSNQ
jgi:hypothetical protein